MKKALTGIVVALIAFTLILKLGAQPPASITQQLRQIVKAEQNAAARLQAPNVQAQQLSGASSNYDVKHYKCYWQLDPALLYIKGNVRISFVTLGMASTITLDLHKQLTVDSVRYKNINTTFVHNLNNTLTINFATPIATNTYDSVTVYYKGIPAVTGFGSFNQDTHSGVPVIWSLSEPYGSKDWWPCKDILNDKADSLDITIACPSIYRSSSIGMLVSDVITGTTRVSTYKHRYPITTYLVAFAVTNYTISSQPFNYGGTNFNIENWVYPESAATFNQEWYVIPYSMQLFTDKFGPYPFARERYAQTQFSSGGGMEHQGNSFLGFPGSLVQAHELAHQWFGDKITCGSWRDIWCNEGFASFIHWWYFEDVYVPVYNYITEEYHTDITSDSTGSVIVADTTDVSKIFSGRLTYQKSAYILHMLRGMLGEATFWACMKAYSIDTKIQYNYTSTADVKRVFENVSGRNLTAFFNQWVYGQGWPTYKLQWYTNANGYINIRINQSQSHSSVSFFEMPVRVQFKNATQDSTITLNIQQQGQLFATRLNFVPDTVLIDPKMWILSKNNSQQKLPTPTLPNNITITPNPAGNTPWIVNISNPTAGNYSLQLINNLGQILSNKTISTQGGDIRTTIENMYLPSAIYTLVVTDGKRRLLTKKIVK